MTSNLIRDYLSNRLNLFFAPFADDFDVELFPTRRLLALDDQDIDCRNEESFSISPFPFSRFNDPFRHSKIGSRSLITTDNISTGNTPWISRRFSGFLPANMDIIEKDNEYDLKMDLPGIRKEDIQINYRNGLLTIEAERKSEIIKGQAPSLLKIKDDQKKNITATIERERSNKENEENRQISDTTNKDGNYYYVERNHGKIMRQVQIPKEVDIDSCQASFNNGVLELNIPKKQETNSFPSKMISIN